MTDTPVAPPPSSKKTVASLLAGAVLIAGGFALYWFFLRPTPLERAREALNRGTPEIAVEVLTARLGGMDLLPAEERPARAALAQAYLMKGSFDDAENAFRTLGDKFPDDPEAPLGLGFLFFSRGEDAFAVEHLAKAKQLAPDDRRASRALATLFNFRGEYDKAREEALSLLNGAPTDAEARRLLGEAELGRGLFAAAVQAFDAVLQASPDNPAARRALAEALLESGELARAEEELSALLKTNPNDASSLYMSADLFRRRSRPTEAVEMLRRLFDENPGRLFIGVALARALARSQDTEGAQTLLLDIGQRLPKLDEVPPPPYASFYEPWDNLSRRRDVRDLRVHFHLASAETYKARYLLPDADKQARLALQLSPRDVDGLRTWTELKRAGGDAREWLKAAEEAARLLPDHPEVLLDHAAALLGSKRFQDALTFAQAAAAACPALSRAHAVLAEAALAAGLKDEAAQAVETALALNDREPAAYLSAGLVKGAKNDWRGAEKDFARAAALDGAFARAHWELAKALDHQKKNREAAAERENALELEPRLYGRR